MADNEVNGWISSIEIMLGSVNDHRVKASSISDVPEQLRKSREEAYKPKMVSIGPLHRGTRKELLYMEEIKWRCMRSLLYRTPEPDESLKKCSEAIYALDEVVRASYANDIRLNSYELAKIMLLDGCFLLELLISDDKELGKNMKSRSPGPGAKVGKMELVLSDLKLLENQIPIFILTVLFQNLFTRDTAVGKLKGIRKIVNGGALFLFGCSSNSSPVDSPNCGHFLELMHWFMTGEEDRISLENKTAEKDGIGQKNETSEEDGIGQENEMREEDRISRENNIREEDRIGPENNHHAITVDENENFNNRSAKPNPKLEHCAASLEAAGVTIAPLHTKKGSMSIKFEHRKDAVTFGCNMKFTDSKLEIQPLHIAETTEVQWRNFIAWEHNRTTHEKFLLREENPTRCKFSQYALLFKDLVCCEHDVQLLKDRKVLLVDDGERSNEDLMTLFRKIGGGIQIDASGDCGFSQQINDLNAYAGARENRRVFWHRCRSIATSTRYTCRDWYVTLKRDHTPTVWKTIGVIAAIVLLGLTIAQTIFAALSL